MTGSTRELLAKYRKGSEEAAEQIFSRYIHRLTSLARLRLSEKIARRIDPEDVVLSAYRSFFVAARNGRFVLDRDGDLWRLLVSITLHKLHRQVAAHQTQKRSMSSETSRESIEFVPSRDPTPDEVLAASEELEAILKELPPLARRVVELRLQGEGTESIAVEIARSERTVRRQLDLAKAAFRRRWMLHSTGDGEQFDPFAHLKSGAVERMISDDAGPGFRDVNELKAPADVAVASGDSSVRLSYRRYLLERFIGSGGSGKVYRSRDLETGRMVAVKFLRKSFQCRPEAIRRFSREAETVSRLNHCGIVRLYGLGQTPRGGYFLVMDWFPAGDLNRRMEQGPISVRDAIHKVCEMALAIQYAHEQGVVHCDLKPANVLLDESGRAVVTDFGLARRAGSDHDHEDSIEGTAGYMALEQAVPGFGEIGTWTDVYGLGAVLYALLAGHAPYTGKRPSDVLSQLIANRPIPDLRTRQRGIPRELEELCLQCLSRNPAQRPGTASNVAARLQACLAGTDFEGCCVASDGTRPV